MVIVKFKVSHEEVEELLRLFDMMMLLLLHGNVSLDTQFAVKI